LLLAACPAPPPPAPPPPPDNGAGTGYTAPAPADAGVAETRDYAQPPAADAAATVVTAPPPIDAGAAPVSERVPASGCFKEGDPSIAKLQAAAVAWTKASFEAAMRRQGLVLAHLSMTRKVLHRGVGGYGSVLQGAKGDTVVAVNGQRFIAGGSSWSGSAYHPQPWEFVKNDRGEIFRLQRQPMPGGSVKNVVLCGCAPRRCGPYGSGCPACGATSQEMYGPLPAGATYKGAIDVRYATATVAVQREHGTCPQQHPCPGPPP